MPVVVALAFPVGASAAGQPGVTYDPGSPSGKEYAIPLVSGRAVGAGTSNQRTAAGIPFGSGITPPGGGGGAHATGKPQGTGGKGVSGRSGRGNGQANTGSQAGGPVVLRPADRARLLRAEEPGGTGLLTVLIALAVLLPSLLVALLLRRRPEQPAG